MTELELGRSLLAVLQTKQVRLKLSTTIHLNYSHPSPISMPVPQPNRTNLMSVKSFIQYSAFALAIAFTAPVLAAEDASMHEVYLAAEAGKFQEAQTMMDKVLRDHPNSAKAHYVEAELLAKQGQLTSA